MTPLLRYLLAAALTTGAGLALAPAAYAQRPDSTSTVKPQLNTAPPGTAPRPTTPARRPQEQSVPVPAPAPANESLPAPRPGADKPSGLDFPPGSRASEQPRPERRYFLYSNFGLGYSSNPFDGGQFSVSLSPSIGYRVTEKLAIGPGISYAYNNISFPRDYQAVGLPRSLSLHSVGVKGFLQYVIFDAVFLHAEYEVTQAQSYDIYQVGQRLEVVKTNRTMNTPLAGVGYRNQISERAAADIVLLYNFNDGYDARGYPLSPYGQPVIRFSFLFDLK
jgi:hypothetical protein